MSRLPRGDSHFNAEGRESTRWVTKSAPSIAASSPGGHVAGRASGARGPGSHHPLLAQPQFMARTSLLRVFCTRAGRRVTEPVKEEVILKEMTWISREGRGVHTSLPPPPSDPLLPSPVVTLL